VFRGKKQMLQPHPSLNLLYPGTHHKSWSFETLRLEGAKEESRCRCTEPQGSHQRWEMGSEGKGFFGGEKNHPNWCLFEGVQIYTYNIEEGKRNLK